MKIIGTTNEAIEDGASVSVTAKMGLKAVLQTTYQICELDGVECPLTLDNEEVGITIDLGTATTVYREIILINLVRFRLNMCFSSDGLQGQHSRSQLRPESIDVRRRVCDSEIDVQKAEKEDFLMVNVGRMQSRCCMVVLPDM